MLPKLAVFFGVRIDALFAIDHEDELERINQILYKEQLTEQNYGYAKRVLEQLLQENPQDVEVMKKYAELQLGRVNKDKLSVGHLMEQAMELSPTDVKVYSLYRAARGGGEYEHHSDDDWFIRVCEPYARNYPQNYELCGMLIEAMIRQKYFDKAEEIVGFMQLPKDEDYRKALYAGDIAVAKGNKEDAKKIWREAPKNGWRGCYEVGERLNRMGDYDKAIEFFCKAFELQTERPRMLDMEYSLAFLYKKLGRFSEAIVAWECIIDVMASDFGVTDGNDIDWAKDEIRKLRECMEKNQ